MKFIHHIADIHIKSSNNDNLRNSFITLINQKPELLIIAGDLFHDKGKIAPNDIEFINWLYTTLTENKVRTIIIPGNHDTNMNDLDNKKSNITKIINNTDYVNCYDESTIITIDEIEFYLFSILDRKLLKPNDNNLTKVMVLHETIPGRLTVKDLSGFDLVMLGDLHATKFLKPNMAYPGAFVQNTKAESRDRGYIVWNLETLTGKFVPIPLLSVQLVIRAENNKCELPTIESKISKLILEYNNCDHDYIKKLKQTIFSNYGNIHEIVNHTIEKVINVKQEHIRFDNDKLFEARIKDSLKLAKIKAFHNKLNITPPLHSNFKIKSMAWSNVLTYKGFNCIDFVKCKNKTVLINGLNASGKSSIIDILLFGLFNYTYRGGKQDILNQDSISGFIKILFSVDKDEYKVEIIINKGRIEPFIFKNNVSETKSSKAETYKHITDVIGIGTAEDFINSNVSLQGKPSLIDSNIKDKKGLTLLLSKITGMEIFKLHKTEAEKIMSANNVEILKLKKTLEKATIIEEEEITTIEKLIETKTKEKENLLRVIEKYTGKLSIVGKKYNPNVNNSYEIKEFEPNFKPTITKEIAYEFITQTIDISKFESVDFDEIRAQSTINYEEQINTLQSKINELNIKFDSKIIPSKIEPKNGKEVSDEIINKFDSITVKLLSMEEYESRINTLNKLKQKNSERLKVLYSNLKPQPAGVINDTELPKIDYARFEMLSKQIKEPSPQVIKPDYYDKYEKYKEELLSIIIADDLDFNPRCVCCRNNKSRISSDITNYNELKEKVKTIEKFKTYNQYQIYKSEHDKLSELIDQETLRRNKKINDEINAIISSNIDSEIEEIKTNMKLLSIYSYKTDVLYTKQLRAFRQYSITTTLSKYNKQMEELKIKYKKQQSDLSLLHFETHVKHYESIEYYKCEIIKTNKKILEKITEIETNLKAKSITYEEINKEIIKLTKLLIVKQTTRDKYLKDKKAYDEHKSEYEIAEEYKNHVDFEKGIPKVVFDNLCKTITDMTNKILYSMNSNFTVLITFEKNVDIQLINGTNSITAERASGYQKSIIEFIIRSVIISISDVSNCGLLFIDEGFSTLDSENLSAFTSILKTFRSGFDTLFIITHLTELKAFADDKIEVVKGESLIYGDLTEESFDLCSISSRKKDLMNVKEFKSSNLDSAEILKRKQFFMPIDDNVSYLVKCSCSVSHKRQNILSVVVDAKHLKLYDKLTKQ